MIISDPKNTHCFLHSAPVCRWTEDEDEIIDRAVAEQGHAWRNIALLLPGRTHSGCRNRWVRLQERRLAQAGMHVTGATGVMDVLRRIGVTYVSDGHGATPNPAERDAEAAGTENGTEESLDAHTPTSTASPLLAEA
jgi:hypothetical protein